MPLDIPILMMRFWSLILIFAFAINAYTQSFELHLGFERIFIDAQYFALVEDVRGLSLFSRARATAEYKSNSETDLFTGTYLNYTTNSGLGGTILGRISSLNSGIDAGIHYFTSGKNLTIFALPSININNELLFSWFSIVRFTPNINDQWKMYSSLELFSAFRESGHVSSIQRLRLGVDHGGNQFGFAINLAERGHKLALQDTNAGVFLRKQF